MSYCQKFEPFLKHFFKSLACDQPIMEGSYKDFGIFLPLVIVTKVWGFATYPIYWLAKQNNKTKYTSRVDKYPTVLMEYSDKSVVLITL